jgi:antitoxin ParD1/3/4
MKPKLQSNGREELKAEIDRGMVDVAKGKLTEFDPESITALGRKLSADRAKSALPKKQE